MPHDPDQPTATRRRMLVGGATGVATALGSLALLPQVALAQSSPTTVDDQEGTTATSVGDREGSTSGTAAASTTTLPAQVAESPEDLPAVLFARGVSFAGAAIYAEVVAQEVIEDPAALVAVAAFHTQHLEGGNTWSGLAGIPSGAQEPNADLLTSFLNRAGRVADQDAGLQLLHQLEDVVAATMLSALEGLQATEGAALAAGLLAAAARRSAVLVALQDEQVGDTPLTRYTPTVQTTAGAVRPSAGA